MKTFRLLTLVLCLVAGTARAQVNITQFDFPLQEDFNILAATGTTNSTLPPGWLFAESGTNANTTYAAGTGSLNTGNTYSFGATSSSERAFGGLQSGTLIPTIGARFINTTGVTITRLRITYRGEQWRLGAAGREDRLDFQYALNAPSLLAGTWLDVDGLDFVAPVVSGALGAINGNDSLNSRLITLEFEVEVDPGAVLSLRWSDFNASGADDGLAIDNFSITAVHVIPIPAISFFPVALNFGDVNAGTTKITTYEVVGENLSDSIAISTTNSVFAISTDNITFSSSAILPASGGIIHIRFSPLVNGLQQDIFEHTSDTTVALYEVSGTGFVQSENIIPIAIARSKPLGTKVTVAGRITVANELGNPAYLQDDTGGIPVFDFALANSVEIGDSVIVTGPIGVFQDQRQISGGGIFFTAVGTTKRFIDPKPIALADLAANEGLLVTVVGVELVNKSFVFYPQSTEKMTNGIIQADLRIDGDTNIPGLAKPQGIVDITGVVGRFQANAQLLPRFEEDVPGATEPATPVDGISKNKTFDVVAWNFEFFGARSEDYGGEEFGPANEQLQLENIRQVLDSLQADIIGVEEVSNDSLFATLVQQLGKYSYRCSDRYSRSFEGPSDDFPPQKVCFIYDTTTVEVLGTRALFEALYDSARTIDPSLLPSYPGGSASSFYSSGRLPYLLRANVTIEGVTETASLIVIHAKSGATGADRLRRLYDGTVLKDSLDAHLSDSPVIILGDLNDDLDQSIVTGMASPYEAFVTDTTHYDPVTRALSDAGARSTLSFGDVIDHQIITNELQDEYLQGSAQILAPFRFIRNYATTTTDHLPVMTRYAFEAPAANFIQSSVVLAEDSTTFVVSVALTKATTSAKQLTVALSGDADNPDDFTTNPAAINGVITLDFPIGADSAAIVITVVNDQLDEATEVADLELQPSLGIEVGASSTFTLTLEDDDIPTIAFKAVFASEEEGSGAYPVKLKLSSAVATDQSVTIYVFEKPGVDYGKDYITEPAVVCNQLTITVPAGSSEVSFNMIPLADKKREKHLEIVAFSLGETTDGLIPTRPLLSLFNIIDVKKKPHFVVFPNPTSGWVKLLAEELDDDEQISAELRYQNGELVFKGKDDLEDLSEKLSHKLKHSRRGIYTLTLTVDDERFQVRIVRQ